MAVPHTQVPIATPKAAGGLVVSIARSEADVRACQALRYQVFAQEMGARLDNGRGELNQDDLDPHCIHLVVRDQGSGEVAATTRLLVERDARRVGRFYSESEFELAGVLALPGRRMEVGRTCVSATYRSGHAIALLWSGLAQLLVLHEVDFLMGCVSLPLAAGPQGVRDLVAGLDARHSLPAELGVRPRLPLPHGDSRSGELTVPGLLRSYLRMGARFSAEACWDPVFDVADLFVLLDRERITRRYARHFVVDP